jgi:hypothetical protein
MRAILPLVALAAILTSLAGCGTLGGPKETVVDPAANPQSAPPPKETGLGKRGPEGRM